VRVVHDRTRGGRLFQTVGEAMRKAGEPNDKLDRATDRTLAEADRKALRGLCRYNKMARYGGLPVFKVLKVSVAILNLIRASMGSHWSLFRVDELESIEPVPVTTRARVFCVRWRRETCLTSLSTHNRSFRG